MPRLVQESVQQIELGRTYMPNTMDLLQKKWHHGSYVPPYQCSCSPWFLTIADLEQHVYLELKKALQDERDMHAEPQIRSRIGGKHHRMR